MGSDFGAFSFEFLLIRVTDLFGGTFLVIFLLPT